jgi:hypothetical protein
MSGTISPNPKPQFFTNAGVPAVGYLLFTYEAGTTTKLATYSDVDLTVPNANPIVLDSAGRCTMFLTPTSYKYVLALPTDTDPPTSPIWTQDNVSAVPQSTVDLDVDITAGEALSLGDVAYLSLGDGSRTSGRWYKAKADASYSSTTSTAMGVVLANIALGSTGAVRISGRVTGLSGLSVGAVYYVSAATAGAMTNTNPTMSRRVGVADSSTSMILSQWLPQAPVLGSWITTVGNTADTNEDILATVTLSAGTVLSTGQSLRFLLWGQTANNADTKTIRVRAIEGGNNNLLVTLAPAASEAGLWTIGGLIIRTGATTARAAANATCGTTTVLTKASSGVSQPTLTWANAIEFRVTAQASATNANDVTMEGGSLTLVQA